MTTATTAPTNTIKGFFQTRHNFGRYPFNPTGTPVKTTNKSTNTLPPPLTPSRASSRRATTLAATLSPLRFK